MQDPSSYETLNNYGVFFTGSRIGSVQITPLPEPQPKSKSKSPIKLISMSPSSLSLSVTKDQDPRHVVDMMLYKDYKIKIKKIVDDANYVSPEEDLEELIKAAENHSEDNNQNDRAIQVKAYKNSLI